MMHPLQPPAPLCRHFSEALRNEERNKQAKYMI
jgi:hypothetical protein